MEVERQFELLNPIMRSAAKPVLDAFNEAAMQASSPGSGSRWVFPQQAVAAEYADKLLTAVWTKLVPALDRTNLHWNEPTLKHLQALVNLVVSEAADALYVFVRRKQAAYPAQVAAAEHVIASAVALHLNALHANLELYVEDRRRREILGVLTELEQRLVADGAADPALTTLRLAKREAEAPEPNRARLKEYLDVLVTSVQGMNAAYDLGSKLLTLVQSI